MTDHATVVREAMRLCYEGRASNAEYDSGLAALAALEREIAEAKATSDIHLAQWTVQYDRVEAAEAGLAEAKQRIAYLLAEARDWQPKLAAAEAKRDKLHEALEAVSDQQPKTLGMIEANGFVFDSIGREPGNWQHLAFSIYTDLCEVDSIARAALEREDA